MFTGIIEVFGIIKRKEGNSLFIDAPFLQELKIGESVAHDGVCLTITKIHADCYEVDLMPETFERTHFRHKKVGDLLNLERSMKADGRFDGHIVQGHCDCVGRLESITPDGNAHILKISFPSEYALYFVEKGSVALNGISLTVIKAEKDFFTVGIIPHTWKMTNLHTLSIGTLMNIETDIFAKYFVKNLLLHDQKTAKIKHNLPSFMVMQEEDIIPLLEESLKKAQYDKGRPIEEVWRDLHHTLDRLP